MPDLMQRVDEAADRHESGRNSLLREDGSRRYSEEEHAEREEALGRAFRAELDAIEAEADGVISGAEEVLARHADLSAQLSSEELRSANDRRPFVAEDAETLPLGELASRAEAAEASGGTVERFLWARYGRRRAGAESAADQNVRLGEDFLRLERALGTLEDALQPQEARDARRTIGEAREAKQRLYLRRRGARSPVELAMNRTYGRA